MTKRWSLKQFSLSFRLPKAGNPGVEGGNSTATDRDGRDLVYVEQKPLIALRHDAKQLKLKATRIRSLQAGQYYSPFRGRGMEFDEVRLYQPGDDVRTLDWKVTARTGKAHTKLFREERERAVFICVDFSASMFFATQGCFKSVQAAKAAAILAWSAHHQGDRLGGLVFNEQIHHEIKPRSGKSGVLHFLHNILELSGKQALSQTRPQNQAYSSTETLLRLRRVCRPGSLVVFISDFRNWDQRQEPHLVELARHNDVVLLFIYDAMEQDLPPAGFYQVGDNNRMLSINTAAEHTRAEYQIRFTQRYNELYSLCQRHHMHFLDCGTRQDVLQVLKSGFGQNLLRGAAHG